ncbi:phosphatase PAP2-related protein [Spirosoma endbachense]|uniref:Phosphatase PAP2 family protein n=1 Tax=Spirosoma endbachense TaxID=2666025 RepID=A0A6P1W0U3_9BACT|nr:phosphatase PAP2-related protein [Spirosoma endbachense]QHV97922.1 phosphatase PAP2 family protein [Spirosoma endbachense]
MSILSPNPTGDLVWQAAWRSSVFRWKFIIGLICTLALLFTFPVFFQTIERHTGPVLNDWVLNQLPPRDVSLWIFLIIWATALLLLIRARFSPAVFMMFVYGYIVVSLSRMLSINLFPLDPPVGLIPLIDPLSNAFYGKTYITKDLFYSGHTSSIFLMFLCLRRWWDRLFAFVGSLLVGGLLLVQHVHYTIDVLGAFVFTYPLYWLGKRIALSGWNNVNHPVDQKASPN